MKDGRRTGTDDWYEFYARLDHAIKNPLTTILVTVDNLRYEPLSPEGQGRLDALHSQADRLRSLLKGLRAIARLSTIEMEEENLDMLELAESLLDAVREEPAAQEICGGHPLTLRRDQGAGKLPAVVGDRDYLTDALYCLIENACKFSPPGKPVDIRVQPEGDWLRLEVADQGIGIPDEDLPHLGKELYRSESVRGTPGDGLGLSRVRVILERHGGTFQVESTLGEGTTVTMLLPLAGKSPGERGV